MTPDPTRGEGAQGHFDTAGTVLLAIGALGLLLGGPLSVLGVPLPHLDPGGLAVTGVLIGSVGALMRSSSR